MGKQLSYSSQCKSSIVYDFRCFIFTSVFRCFLVQLLTSCLLQYALNRRQKTRTRRVHFSSIITARICFFLGNARILPSLAVFAFSFHMWSCRCKTHFTSMHCYYFCYLIMLMLLLLQLLASSSVLKEVVMLLLLMLFSCSRPRCVHTVYYNYTSRPEYSSFSEAHLIE